MAFVKYTGIEISGISACVPRNTICNIDYPEFFSEKEKKKIIKITGISERRFANDNTTASDLGFQAAKDIITNTGTKKEEIKFLLFLSQTPDYLIPFTGNILQHKLELSKECASMDINAGCSGFIYGLNMAFALQQSLKEGKVLLIIAETMSKILSKKDRSTSLLFGDGGVAILIENSFENTNSYFDLFSDGKGFNSLIIPDGGYRNVVSENSLILNNFEDGSIRNRLNLFMDGGEIFDFTMREIPKSVLSILEKTGISINQIDKYFFHQSNSFIIKQFGRILNIPSEKLILNIERFGNTSGVSIPLAMVTEKEQILKNKSAKLLCSGYGAGLSWANCIINFSPNYISELIEYE